MRVFWLQLLPLLAPPDTETGGGSDLPPELRTSLGLDEPGTPTAAAPDADAPAPSAAPGTPDLADLADAARRAFDAERAAFDAAFAEADAVEKTPGDGHHRGEAVSGSVHFLLQRTDGAEVETLSDVTITVGAEVIGADIDDLFAFAQRFVQFVASGGSAAVFTEAPPTPTRRARKAKR